jgi:hypothetical protein
MGYALVAVRGLEACPFCHEMFPKGETDECPICGVRVVPASRLPESAPTDEDGVPRDPAAEVLPWMFLGRARGPLLLIAVLGGIAFCLPWVHTFTPDRRVFTGIDIARRTGLTWAVGVAWFTLLPLVGSRRTIAGMRGARLAAAVLSAIPMLVTLALLLNPPRSAEVRGIVVHLRFAWDPWIFVTLGLAAVATFLSAFRFGGKVDDIEVKRGTSAGHTVH